MTTDSRELRRIYNTVDENGDGVLTIREIRVFFEKLGIDTSEEDIHSIISPLRNNGDDTLRYEEFASVCEFVLEKGEEDEDDSESEDLLEAFRVFDKNEDGYISSTELQHILTNLGFPQGADLANCEKMIRVFDLDRNGVIDYQEFKNMMTNAML